MVIVATVWRLPMAVLLRPKAGLSVPASSVDEVRLLLDMASI